MQFRQCLYPGQICQQKPYFQAQQGPYPPSLAQTYPLTAEVPDRLDDAALEAAAEGVRRLAEANPETAFVLVHDGWPASVVGRLPDGVTVTNLGATSG